MNKHSFGTAITWILCALLLLVILAGCEATKPCQVPTLIAAPATLATNTRPVDDTEKSYHVSSEEQQQDYIRKHHCRFVRHWSLAEYRRYSIVINGRLTIIGAGVNVPYSEYSCGGSNAYVDDVNGKPWRP